jgi:hypothetical protein
MICSNASRYSQGGGTGRKRIIRFPGGGVNQALPVILKAQECKKMQKTNQEKKKKWHLLLEEIEFLTGGSFVYELSGAKSGCGGVGCSKLEHSVG